MWFAAATMIAGCGDSPTVTCQMEACGQGTARMYQACARADSSTSYNLGDGTTCACSPGQQDECQTCATTVATYCGGMPDGGTAGTTGLAGMPGSGGTTSPTACTATFSGAFTGTVSNCTVEIISTPTPNLQWTISASAGDIAGTRYHWGGVNMTFAGMPAAVVYDQTASLETITQVTAPAAANSPVWAAAYGAGSTFGTAMLTISALGTSASLNGATIYATPHGTFVATLADQNATPMPVVMVTVAF
jgi:hypothetical protein